MRPRRTPRRAVYAQPAFSAQLAIGAALAGPINMASDTILMAIMIAVIMIALVAIAAAALAAGPRNKV